MHSLLFGTASLSRYAALCGVIETSGGRSSYLFKKKKKKKKGRRGGAGGAVTAASPAVRRSRGGSGDRCAATCRWDKRKTKARRRDADSPR